MGTFCSISTPEGKIFSALFEDLCLIVLSGKKASIFGDDRSCGHEDIMD
ncbi:MAG: hypothetical protein HQK61_12640 [Desulfamplus sp.]|nr:hypothetical protein [Desulfamplus sp.]